MTITSLCNYLFVTVHGSVDHLSLYLVIVYCPCDLLFLQLVVLWGVSFHQSWLQGRPLNFIQVLVFFITLTHIGVLFCMCQPLHAFIHAFSISHGFCLYHSRLGLLSLNTSFDSVWTRTEVFQAMSLTEIVIVVPIPCLFSLLLSASDLSIWSGFLYLLFSICTLVLKLDLLWFCIVLVS